MNTATQRAVTDEDLVRWLGLVQPMVTTYETKNFPSMVAVGHGTVLSFERGQKYARIVATSGPSRSAWAFIDLATGDILKSESWKRPAKGVRGNIFADDPLAGVTAYGAEYRR